MNTILASRSVQQALAFIKEDDARTLQEQLEMVQIPAPSYHEKEKAEYVLRKFQEAGLSDVYMDEICNVFGTVKGTAGGGRIMIAAHTDTVFPEGTDVTVKREGARYIAPGIGDDTRAVAELLTMARAMVKFDIHGDGDIVFCANVCEEGLGDLKGVKKIFAESRDISGFVTIDNAVPGCIIYTATGSLRYKVTFEGPGGHSFSAFGIPSPIHALGRTMAAVADFQVPAEPKTTFNIGVIEGGTSVNTIAESASMLVDIRSNSEAELKRLSDELFHVAEEALNAENGRGLSDEKLTLKIETVGERPAGTQDKNASIVTAAWEAALAVGVTPEYRGESSTDANVPINLGIPAVCVGRGGIDGGTHTVHEWYENVDAYLAPQRTMLLALRLSRGEELDHYLANEPYVVEKVWEKIDVEVMNAVIANGI